MIIAIADEGTIFDITGYKLQLTKTDQNNTALVARKIGQPKETAEVLFCVDNESAKKIFNLIISQKASGLDIVAIGLTPTMQTNDEN